MIALVILAILALVFLGVGFTIHWLFIIAAICALLWLISFFLGTAGGRTRRGWY